MYIEFDPLMNMSLHQSAGIQPIIIGAYKLYSLKCEKPLSLLLIINLHSIDTDYRKNFSKGSGLNSRNNL